VPKALALPNAARVVLGPCDDSVALIVEGARENLVDMPLQYLQTFPRLC